MISRDRFLPAAALLFLASFGLYLATLYPTVAPYRDSGDMAASAYSLGVAHPPGYPFYVLAVKLGGALLPFGNWAYRANVLSALFASAALAGLLLFLWRQLGGGPWLLALGGLAAVPSYWALAQASEMYSLNALFTALILLCWPLGARPGNRFRSEISDSEPSQGARSEHNGPNYESDERRGRRPEAEIAAGMDYSDTLLGGGVGRPELCGLFYGLGLANHQTLLLTLPATLWVFWRAELPGRRWVRTAGFFALGLGLYIVLPVRSWTRPEIDWGEPRSLRNFWRVLTRADYGGLRLHPERAAAISWEGFREAAVFGARALWQQAGPLGTALAGLGLAALRGPWVAGAFLAFLFSGPAFVLVASLDPAKPESLAILEPHLVLPLIFLALLGAAGLHFLAKRFGRAGAAVAAVLAAAWAAWAVTSAWNVNFHRRDFAVMDYAQGLLASLPRGAILMEPDDPTAFTLSYLAVCHALRPDVVPALYIRTRWGYERLKRRHPELLPEREIASGQELFSALLDLNVKRGVFADLPQKIPASHRSLPLGLANKVLAPGERAAPLLDEALRRMELLRAREAPRSGAFFTRHATSYGASALNNLGIHFLSAGRAADAEKLFRRSLLLEPELAEAWSNLGNLRFREGRSLEAASLYGMAVRRQDSAALRYNLGRALWSAGREVEARHEYEAAKGSPDAQNDLGLMDFRSGRIEEALVRWDALAREQPAYAPVRYNLGLAFRKRKEYARAIEAFEAFRALASTSEDRAEADTWLATLRRERGSR